MVCSFINISSNPHFSPSSSPNSTKSHPLLSLALPSSVLQIIYMMMMLFTSGIGHDCPLLTYFPARMAPLNEDCAQTLRVGGEVSREVQIFMNRLSLIFLLPHVEVQSFSLVFQVPFSLCHYVTSRIVRRVLRVVHYTSKEFTILS